MLRLISGFKDLKVWETREGALRLKSEGRGLRGVSLFLFFLFLPIQARPATRVCTENFILVQNIIRYSTNLK